MYIMQLNLDMMHLLRAMLFNFISTLHCVNSHCNVCQTRLHSSVVCTNYIDKNTCTHRMHTCTHAHRYRHVRMYVLPLVT